MTAYSLGSAPLANCQLLGGCPQSFAMGCWKNDAVFHDVSTHQLKFPVCQFIPFFV